MKPKMLVLTPRFPYPVIGGDRLRIYHLCQELSKRYELTLLSLCETKDEMLYATNDKVFTRVEKVYLPKWRSYINCLLTLPTKIPLQVAYYRSKKFKAILDGLLKEHDLVLAHLIRTGHYLDGKNCKKVLEMTDAISLNYERVKTFSKASGFKNIVYSVEQQRLSSYEKKIYKDFDLAILVSRVDKDYLAAGEADADKLLVCSNGVNSDFFNSQYESDQKTIVFIGNMISVQNLDAARWFATTVFPKLLKKGDFCFKVVGRIQDEHRDEFNKMRRVYATGSVDSIPKEVNNAFIGICPMRLGAGVQNKVLEYMALGLPTITSTLGHEGINATPGKELLVADSEEEYISAILKLKHDEQYAQALSQNGKAFVKENHNWSNILSVVVKRIDKISASN